MMIYIIIQKIIRIIIFIIYINIIITIIIIKNNNNDNNNNNNSYSTNGKNLILYEEGKIKNLYQSYPIFCVCRVKLRNRIS